MASNYLVTLMDVAQALAAAGGLDADAMRTGLLELAAGAIQNVESKGLPDALTGPIRRGDGQTVEGHLEAVHTSLPEASPLYRELGLWTVDLARRCGDASEEELLRITKLLQSKG
jgi:predicted short-subunit dehydrogenase-like oxidoreductase (DUF2520 family)